MTQTIAVSSVVLWLVVTSNLLLTLALVRRSNAPSAKVDALEVGQAAPNFVAETLDGESVSLSAFAGKALSLLVVSPACGPCREAAPLFEELRDRAKAANVELAIVSTGDLIETRAFAEELHLDLPMIVAPRDSNTFAKDYKIRLTPTFHLIDTEGRVVVTGQPSLALKGHAWDAILIWWDRHPMQTSRNIRVSKVKEVTHAHMT